jgi:hypothetical protein
MESLNQPTNIPPTNLPTIQPNNIPTNQPTNLPTNLPTNQPNNIPSNLPNNQPEVLEPMDIILKAIDKLGDDKKQAILKKLNAGSSLEDISERENREIAEMIKKKRMQVMEGDSDVARSSEVMALRAKMDAMQLDMIDMMRHMKDYTREYMEVSKRPMVEGLTSYVEQLTQQGNILNKIEKAKEAVSEENPVGDENPVGFIGGIFNTAKNTVKGVMSGANGLLNSAAINGSNAINSILPNSDDDDTLEIDNLENDSLENDSLENDSPVVEVKPNGADDLATAVQRINKLANDKQVKQNNII